MEKGGNSNDVMNHCMVTEHQQSSVVRSLAIADQC